MPVVGRAFGNDVDDATGSPGAIASGGRPAEHFNALDHFWRNPVGVPAGVALAAPAVAHRVTGRHRHAVNQDQGIFRPHTANIDLAVVAAAARRAVAGEVYPGHFTNDFRKIVYRRVLFDVLRRNNRDARLLLQRLFSRRLNHHGFTVVESLFCCVRALAQCRKDGQRK